ncbi:MAG: SUMF1/EgtB/PvdO family nonheme iron enzyme [Acidobacteria bacterium]|nr:SUMF1/EgtB/PvdO family nonheme iron enzyme [Acidobacteriota bacterium]
MTTCPDDGMQTMQTLSGVPVLEEKYHLERRLGQGGMGVVYKARHAYLKTQHAIKVILPDLVGNDPQLVTRFRQEALAAAAIRHQNVVGVSDYGVAFGTMPFLVMEYVEGESLHDLLAREGRLPPQRALELMTAICAGVGAAHHQGIVHRDLKPLNVMICTGKKSMSEAVKILDFGLAKIKSGELLGSFIQAQTTGLMGSPYYMAPEQWADEEPDVRADIYSLGVMLFQMLTGDVPFKGSSIPAIMKKHLSDLPPTFAQLGVQVSPQIEQAVRHSVEKNRQNRTQSVEQLVDELRNAVNASAGAQPTVGYSTGTALPVAMIKIHSDPPKSRVFIDNIAVGLTHDDGWLLLEGIQSGNHRIRVSHDGFRDWETDVVCDGQPQQVVARLMDDSGGIPRPTEGAATMVMSGSISNSGLSQTNQQSQFPVNQQSQFPMQNTAAAQNWQTGQQSYPNAVPTRGKSSLIVGIIGIAAVLVLTSVGLFAAWKMGMFGSGTTGINNGISNSGNSNTQNLPPVKTEMVKISGGKFTMGRKDGDPLEKPEFEVEVKDFEMDKTEVTNAEYFAFVQATGYNPVPSNWENSKPLTAEMNFPVRYINLDDVKAFAEWRSKSDGKTYRLPTETEWEYAARNGGDNVLYPWGDTWYEDKAQVRRDLTFAAVGSKPEGANKWGVLDLVGNVWEWTSSPARAYKGSDLAQQVEERVGRTHSVVRGAFDLKKDPSSSTSTYRVFKDSKDRDKAIGFRLVRSD